MGNIPKENPKSLDLLMQLAHGWEKKCDSSLMKNLLNVAEGGDLNLMNLPRVKKSKKELSIA